VRAAPCFVLAAVTLLLGREVARAEDPAEGPASPGKEHSEEKARIYTTREERREAGEEHRITSWLAVSDLLEVEAGRQWFGLLDPSPDTRDRDVSTTLQLGLEATPRPWLKGEAIFELEHEFEGDAPRATLDEGTASLLVGDFELEAGKLYVPFGEYFSHFVSGPVLEFGETRGSGLDLSWGPGDRLDLSAYLYLGPAEKTGTDGKGVNGGFSVSGSPFEVWTLGLSYLSDLADSKDRLLEDYDNRYASRVDALSAYTVLGIDRFELTTEVVHALSAFVELPPDRNQPSAWNLELAFYPKGRLDGALRLEGSQDLENAPRLQGGAALSWRPTRAASVTLEYLQGSYEGALTDEGLDTVRRLGAQVSFVL